MKQNLIGLNKQGEVISYDTAKKSLQDPPLTDFLNPLMDCPFPVLQIVGIYLHGSWGGGRAVLGTCTLPLVNH